MKIEATGLGMPAEEHIRFEQYHKEALAIAQKMSHEWPKLTAALQSNPLLLADDPDLWSINELTSSPKTGIQRWFESQTKSIEEGTGDDINTKSRMMYRLKEDLEKIEKQFNDVVK